jgi:hypothetical protein
MEQQDHQNGYSPQSVECREVTTQVDSLAQVFPRDDLHHSQRWQ